MKITDLYGWTLPDQAEFIGRFRDNEVLVRYARDLWASLDSCAVWFVIAFAIMAIMFACVYYGPYNNRPGRHYKSRYWILWMGIDVLLTVVITLLIGLIGVDSPLLPQKIGMLVRISGANMVYSAVVYFVVSLFVCNMPFLKTNAYRFLKIGK